MKIYLHKILTKKIKTNLTRTKRPANKEIKTKIKVNLHGKPGDVSEKLNLNPESESDPQDAEEMII